MAEADINLQTSSLEEDTRPVSEEINPARPSSLEKAMLFRYLKREFRDDASHSSVWRREAKEDFDFVAGRQWTADEKSQLKDQLRPEVVFNRAITIIKAVAGFEINARQEIQYLPQNTSQTAANEVLTGASKWMGEQCDAEDEESEAFGHTLICGMGFTESRMDYELQRNGKYVEEWTNPLEMYWDRRARKKNLVDARRMWRVKKMTLADAQDLVGKEYDRVQLDARWAVGLDPEEETKTLEEKRRREENATDNFTEPVEVHIVHAQWWERETYWLLGDPVTNRKFELTEKEYRELTRRLKVMAKFMPEGMVPKYSAVKLTRRRYKQCFLGAEILGEVENAPDPEGFSWRCITGEPDFNKGTWFGLIRIMRDPAKWSNKFFSQIMHILNSNAKGGIFAEEDIATDIRKFEDNYAKPTAISYVKRGALSGEKPKWQAKPTSEFPQGFHMLLEFAVSSIRDVTGINLELLGLRDMNQPGILEAMRKQAGMTVLATLFDSLRRFRKLIGRTRLYFIQNFISDGRIIRITGPEGVRAIPLIRDKCLGEYDVIVDDTPTSPNQKEANWAIIAPLLPMFKDQLAAMPELLVAILEYSPLPSRLVELLKALISRPNPEQEQSKKLAIAALIAKINKDQAQAEKANAEAGSSQATAMYDLAMAQHLLAKEGLALDGEAGNPLDNARKLAEIGTETAKADKLRADTAGVSADAARTRVEAMIAAMSPIPQQPPGAPA